MPKAQIANEPAYCKWIQLYRMKQATVVAMEKSEIIAIAYSAVVKQVVKLSKSNAESNHKLFALGEDVGLRAADEVVDRSTNSYKPDEVVSSFLKNALREFTACEVAITNAETSYQKTRFTVKLRLHIKDNPLCDFIVLAGELRQSESCEGLNYNAITMGFVSGCLKSMAYHPTVNLISDSLLGESVEGGTSAIYSKSETSFNVEMWKQKEED